MQSEKPKQVAEICFKASCACGRMTYDSAERPSTVQACHCVTCRKLSGGPFQAFADVKSKSVTFYDNMEHLRYEGLPKDDIGGITFLRLSKVGERAFCVTCHASLAMRYKHQPEDIGLTLGTVDEGSVPDAEVKEGMKVQKHIFVSQKAWWYDVKKDGIPTHERFEGKEFEQEMKAWEGKEG